MTFSKLPLGYCTNVHAGQTFEEVLFGIENYTSQVCDRIGETVAAGLWLGALVIEELTSEPQKIVRLSETLQKHNLPCYSLNAFPFGDFHSERVKKNVYFPNWAEPARLEYTKKCAQVLAQLLPTETEGSISTLPLGFKNTAEDSTVTQNSFNPFLDLAESLRQLFEKTGKTIRIAIEPEPLCILETTEETIAFFRQLYAKAEEQGLLETVKTYIGVNYDVCHQAVEFEDVTESIRSLEANGIRINKVHITCALQLDRPAENGSACEELLHYVEPRYLHQTFAKTQDSKILHRIDLNKELIRNPDEEFLHAETWRIHFHVPVNAERIGALKTTRPVLREALQTVAALVYAPHLEVETYTWNVLPNAASLDVVEGIAQELRATKAMLSEIASAD